MSKFRISFTLLMLCACLMPLTVYQADTVSGKLTGFGGRIGRGGEITVGGGGGTRPTVNVTARPQINQPTGRPLLSFTKPPTLTSISFSRTMRTSFTFTRSSWSSWSSWTGMSFTRTVVTSTSHTFSPTFTFLTTTPYYGGWTFIQYPPNYNFNVGSFTLDHTLIGQNGLPCTYYTYFEFNAYAGQQLQARLWTPGATINYIIVPQNLAPILQQMGCGYGQSGARSQAHSFNSQITLNWTAPQTNQYVIIFYSMTPYSSPVYFLPGP